MRYDYSLGIFGNITRLYTERNKVNGRVDNTDSGLVRANETISENQAENDEILLDQEERIILLEVGE